MLPKMSFFAVFLWCCATTMAEANVNGLRARAAADEPRKISNLQKVLSGVDYIDTNAPFLGAVPVKSQIFEARYSNPPKLSPDGKFAKPDGIDVVSTLECNSNVKVTEMSTEYDLVKKSASEMSFEVTGQKGAFSGSFQSNVAFNKMNQVMKKEDQTVLVAEAKCTIYTPMIQLLNLPMFTQNFINFLIRMLGKKIPGMNSVEAALTGEDLIKSFGTHFISSGELGASVTRYNEITNDNLEKLSSMNTDVNAAVSASYFVSEASATASNSEEKELSSYFSKFVQTSSKRSVGSPIPANEDTLSQTFAKWSQDIVNSESLDLVDSIKLNFIYNLFDDKAPSYIAAHINKALTDYYPGTNTTVTADDVAQLRNIIKTATDKYCDSRFGPGGCPTVEPSVKPEPKYHSAVTPACTWDHENPDKCAAGHWQGGSLWYWSGDAKLFMTYFTGKPGPTPDYLNYDINIQELKVQCNIEGYFGMLEITMKDSTGKLKTFSVRGTRKISEFEPVQQWVNKYDDRVRYLKISYGADKYPWITGMEIKSQDSSSTFSGFEFKCDKIGNSKSKTFETSGPSYLVAFDGTVREHIAQIRPHFNIVTID